MTLPPQFALLLNALFLLFFIGTPALGIPCSGYLARLAEGPLAVTRRAVVVIDGISSAHRFAPELRKRGFGVAQGGGPIIHVMSADNFTPSLMSKFHPEHYDVLIRHESLESTLAQLKKYDVAAVITGAETGVNLSDQLSEAMGLRTNGTALSEARRNKYLMAETIRAAGIRAVKQVKTTTLEGVLAFADAHGKWPIVLKPLASAGTDGVTICRTREELEIAFRKVSGKTNALGLVNTEVLVQEFLQGDEYVFDVVARDGQFVVTDLWRYTKRDIVRPEGTFRVYDWDELLPYEGDVQRRIIEYGLPVLKALGNLNGPSHMEVIVTPEGPVLVEVGARAAGTDLPGMVEAATGHSQITLTVDAYLFPERFRPLVGRPYVLHRHALSLDIISDGGILAPGFTEAVKALPSFWNTSFHFKPGDLLPVTNDLLTSPGSVFLVHDDPRQLREDAARINELRDRFFLAPRRR